MAYTPKTWTCGELITDAGLNNIEQGIQEALGCCDGGLPEVTTDDNGDVLTVVDGEWEKAEPLKYVKDDSTDKGGVVENDVGHNVASGAMSHAEGGGTTASGDMSHAEGGGTTASGAMSHAEGSGTTASGQNSHVEGAVSKAEGANSHAEGFLATASGFFSHAEGYNTVASGESSHAEGCNTVASEYYSHAEGNAATASGQSSHAEGYNTVASGSFSHAEGYNTVANHFVQHVFGKYNVEDPSTSSAGSGGTYIEIVGNGTGDSARSNARTLDWSGNEVIAGTLSQSSDRRLKEHIDYLGEDAEEFIRGLKPAHYIKDDRHHVGFYAQDVEESDKWDCMTGEMNGYKTLGYTEIIAPLVAYCQSLEKRIQELENK